MVDTKSDAVRRGIGKLADVSALWCNVPPEDCDVVHLVGQLAESLRGLQNFPDWSHVVGALLCAYQNEDFRKTGELWRLDDDNRITKNYIGERDGRAAIADLAGL